MNQGNVSIIRDNSDQGGEEYIFTFFKTSNQTEDWPKQYPDKVYKFSPSHTIKSFKLDFRKQYYYRINFELVSPGECNMSIKMSSPSGILYSMYNESLFFYPPDDVNAKGDSLKFGTTEDGNHTLTFDVYMSYTLNIHISMAEETKVLHDKLSGYSEETNDTKGYDVTVLKNDDDGHFVHKFKEYLVDLENDTMYRILMQRVSPMDRYQNSDIYLNITILDPESSSYIIYPYYIRLPDGFQSIETLFGAARVGSYKITFGFAFCNCTNFNFAYIFYKLNEIGQGLNETQASDMNNPANDTNNSTTQNQTWAFVISEEAYFLIIIGGISAFFVVLVALQRSKVSIKGIEDVPKNKGKTGTTEDK